MLYIYTMPFSQGSQNYFIPTFHNVKVRIQISEIMKGKQNLLVTFETISIHRMQRANNRLEGTTVG